MSQERSAIRPEFAIRHCLVIDDDPSVFATLVRFASASLIAYEWRWTHERTAALAVARVQQQRFDAIAMVACRDASATRRALLLSAASLNRAPVIVYAQDAFIERAALLLEGFDVMTRPLLTPDEFFARLEVAARDAVPLLAPIANASLRIGGLVIEPEQHCIRRNDIRVPLTPNEFSLVETLAARFDQIVPYADLAAAIGYDRAWTRRALLEAIRVLRAKVATLGVEIDAVSGVGCRLRAYMIAKKTRVHIR